MSISPGERSFAQVIRDAYHRQKYPREENFAGSRKGRALISIFPKQQNTSASPNGNSGFFAANNA